MAFHAEREKEVLPAAERVQYSTAFQKSQYSQQQYDDARRVKKKFLDMLLAVRRIILFSTLYLVYTEWYDVAFAAVYTYIHMTVYCKPVNHQVSV